jgi:hypothetical protein
VNTLEPLCPHPQQVGALGLKLDMRRLPDGGGASPVDHHDSVFLRERCRITPIWPFIELRTLGEGPYGHEASHHAEVLKLVLDGVCVVWAGLLDKPIEVVR